mmetsp:Transcript_11079/g.24339  ORF Transcript_11079/g.24339 Transcript_11079/m.24339 type:complete len:326 (-) Transcript_11079:148-1125(-)
MGFPAAQGGASAGVTYGEPKALPPLPPCRKFEDLPEERRKAVRIFDANSSAKELTPGWINQDSPMSAGLPGTALIFGVFDGHGRLGHNASRIAAERLPSHMASTQEDPLTQPKKALQNGFRKTDNDIFSAMGADVEFSGTTGVVVMLDPGKQEIHVGNVGDSRAVLGQYTPDAKSPRWDALALTEDLKPDSPEEQDRIMLSGGHVAKLMEAGEEVGPARVWDNAAMEKPGLATSRTLGDGCARTLGVIADPVVTSRKLQAEDRFLLIATDGLWDSLGNEQAVRICAKFLHMPQVALKALVEAVRREEGGQLVDDTTIVLVVFAER